MNTRVADLFHEVADFSDETRARYFEERDIDIKTRGEVEALLAFDRVLTSSLDEQIGRVAKSALDRFDPKNLPCGPYRLKDLLGRGGMGSVYSAERTDGEVSQRVAVKLLRPGSDDPHSRKRFLAERQILAALSHPNIARLLDAGHRTDGQPYLVMEYVEGKPIDQYAQGLNLRHKLRLFLKVCGAVAYLHRNLVVHRDLKPQNLLVTKEGEPKLLDFGIAKMLELGTDSTVTSMRMLTPDYASPEQVNGSSVTTATDIYSLGALLYRLLTGVSAHKFERTSAEAITAVICEGKITPPAKVNPELRGDLDTILMKALRLEPQERYGTIEQFAEDLENYLESRPIRARKGDTWYKASKFLRRHWLPVSAVAVALVGLSAGLAFANHERSIAQQSFGEVRKLANKLFDIDIEVRKQPGNTKARQMIVDTSLDYLRRLSADAERDPSLALEVGNAYMRVARVQGVPISSNLGEIDKSAQNLVLAEKFVHKALDREPGNRIAMLRYAQIAHDRMLLARNDERRNEALALAQVSAQWLEKFHAQKDDVGELPSILTTYMNVADQFALGRKYDEALNLCERGIEISRMFHHMPYLGTFLWVESDIFLHKGDVDKAVAAAHESVKLLDPGAQQVDLGRIMNYTYALIIEGRVLGQEGGVNAGRRSEAVASYEHAFKIADEYVHKDPHDQTSRGRLAVAGLGMADILRHSDPQRALEVYDHVLRHMGEIQGNSSFRRFESSALFGAEEPLLKLGRGVEAKKRLDLAFEKLRGVSDYPSSKVKPGTEVDLALCALGDYKEANGDVAGALQTYRKLLDLVLAWGPEPDRALGDAIDMSRVYGALGRLYGKAGDTAAKMDFEGRRRELWRHWNAALPNNSFVESQLKASLL
jgi:tRNA A-37 threonylcarbamoyl transferase component Bud32/tetratricopeptide (TPR) repeat protein